MRVSFFLIITVFINTVVIPITILSAPPVDPQIKDLIKTKVTVDVSENLGKMPEIFKTGVFEVNENFLPMEGRNYLQQKFFSEQLPGATTIFIPLWADSFKEFKQKVEREGVLIPPIKEAKKVVLGGGRVLFDLQIMPRWLSSNLKKGEYWRYPPKNYEQWRELIAYTVRFLSNEVKDADYRVWEEVDIGLTKELRFWNGTRKEFYKLYKYSVQGIKSMDSDARITFGNAHANSDIVNGMIDYVAKNKLPLDYILYHPFGTPPYINDYKDVVKNIQAKLQKVGMDNKTAIHSESWNSWLEFGKPNLPNGQPDERSRERDTEYNAAYVIQSLFAQDAGGIKHHSFFSRIDPHYARYFEEDLHKITQQFYGDWGMFTRDLIIKPVFNAFRALSILSGKNENSTSDRLSTSFNEYGPITAISSQSKDKIRVLLVHNIKIPLDRVQSYKKRLKKIYVDRYSDKHYGDTIKSYKNCVKEGNSLNKCISLLPQDLQPFMKCLSEGKSEKCGQFLPKHLGKCMQMIDEYLENYEQYTKEVGLVINNLPFHGEAELTTYTIDNNHSNSCRYNKRTERKPTQTECGINGEVDNMVKQARDGAYIIATRVIEKYPTLKPKKLEIFYNLFYYGKYEIPNEKTIRNKIWIDKINSDSDVSLEGSKKIKKIKINKNGSAVETFDMQPNGIILIEISPIK